MQRFDRAFAASTVRGLASVAGLAVCALALAGCGNQYRPVVSAISPTGPAGQPQKYALAISSSGPTAPGLSNLIDFGGDTIVNETTIGVNPQYLILGSSGSEAYVINGDGTLNNFAVSTSLIQSQIDTTTLPANANPISLFPQGNYVYVAEQGLNAIGQLSGVAPPVFQQNLPTGAQSLATQTTATTYTVGAQGAPRVYALVQNGTANGYASAIETTTNTLSANLPVGVAPVYGVMTADDRRAFVLNSGSNTVTVINAQTNALDTFTPQTGTGVTSTIAVGTHPIWADFALPLSEMLVVNQGNGSTPGTVSVISIPLCTANAIANPNCDPNNPIDALGFGNVVATIPVGINPVMIAVLQDGTQAFVANAGQVNVANPSASLPGSVSVINLQTNTVIATIPTILNANALPTDGFVHGYPTYIAATTGTPTSKVYVVSGMQAFSGGTTIPATMQGQFSSTDLTILRSDTDQVLLHLPLQGTGVSVRVSAQ